MIKKLLSIFSMLVLTMLFSYPVIAPYDEPSFISSIEILAGEHQTGDFYSLRYNDSNEMSFNSTLHNEYLITNHTPNEFQGAYGWNFTGCTNEWECLAYPYTNYTYPNTSSYNYAVFNVTDWAEIFDYDYLHPYQMRLAEVDVRRNGTMGVQPIIMMIRTVFQGNEIWCDSMYIWPGDIPNPNVWYRFNDDWTSECGGFDIWDETNYNDDIFDNAKIAIAYNCWANHTYCVDPINIGHAVLEFKSQYRFGGITINFESYFNTTYFIGVEYQWRCRNESDASDYGYSPYERVYLRIQNASSLGWYPDYYWCNGTWQNRSVTSWPSSVYWSRWQISTWGYGMNTTVYIDLMILGLNMITGRSYPYGTPSDWGWIFVFMFCMVGLLLVAVAIKRSKSGD